MAILLNDNLNIAVNKPADSRFGPYLNLSDADAKLPVYKRYIGLTVGIFENGEIVEYWFKSSTQQLELKTQETTGTSDKRTVVSENTNLEVNRYYLVDSSLQSFNLVLPSSPEAGDFIWIQDAKNTWEDNPITVDRNGKTILNLEESLYLDANDTAVLLTYVGGLIGWDVKELAGNIGGENSGSPTLLERRILLSANANLNSNKYYLIDSSAAELTFILPSSPVTGDFIWLQDAKGNWEDNPATIDRNGKTILGLQDSLSLNVSNTAVLLTYVGGLIGWDVKELAGDTGGGSTNLLAYVGATGATGSPGATGANGLSAYELAVNQGFIGSQYDWMHTLAIPLKEKVYIATTSVNAPATSPFNININSYQAYVFLEGAQQDFSVNFRGDSTVSLNSVLSIGEAITCALIVVNQDTPYKLDKVFIDGNNIGAFYNYIGIDAVANETATYALYIIKTGNNQFFVAANQAPLQLKTTI